MQQVPGGVPLVRFRVLEEQGRFRLVCEPLTDEISSTESSTSDTHESDGELPTTVGVPTRLCQKQVEGGAAEDDGAGFASTRPCHPADEVPEALPLHAEETIVDVPTAPYQGQVQGGVAEDTSQAQEIPEVQTVAVVQEVARPLGGERAQAVEMIHWGFCVGEDARRYPLSDRRDYVWMQFGAYLEGGPDVVRLRVTDAAAIDAVDAEDYEWKKLFDRHRLDHIPFYLAFRLRAQSGMRYFFDEGGCTFAARRRVVRNWNE